MIVRQIRFEEYVGRAPELRFLREQFNAVGTTGRGATVLIVGEAGLGKSRLLREFGHSLGEVAHRTVTGACFQHRRGSLEPFMQIVKGLAEGGGEPLPTSLAADDDRSPAERKLQIFDLLLDRLRRASANGPPLVVAIEDLHWADDATLELIAYVVKHIVDLPCLMVVTCRSDAVQHDDRLLPLLPQLLREGAHAIYLDPLSLTDTRVLVNSVLGAGISLSSDVIARVQDLSGGNPLYLEELLRDAIDQAKHGRTSRDRIPNTLKATVLQRLRRLPKGARELLTTAAVLGETFDLSLLATIVQLPAREVISGLQRAVDARLVYDLPEAPERYRFQHALIREALYAELTAATATMLHGSAAAALERRLDSDARTAELAYHWSAASVPAKAVEYNIVAGDAAMAVFCYRDAARYYRYALEFVKPSEHRRADLCKKLATALYYDGVTTESKPYFWEALHAYIASSASNDAARLVMFLYRIYWYDGDAGGLEQTVAVATDLAKGKLDPSVRCDVLVMVVSYLLHNGKIEQARKQFKLVVAEPGQDVRTQIALQRFRAWFAFLDGNLADATKEYQTVLRLAKALADPALLARHFEEYYALTGQIDETLRTLKYAYQCCRDQKVGPIGQSFSAMMYAEMLYLNGQLDAAAALLDEALIEQGDFPQTRVLVPMIGIPIALAVDRGDIVARCAHEDVIESVFATGSASTIAKVVAAFAALHISQGRFDTAAALLHRAMEALEEPSVFDGEFLAMVAQYGYGTDLPKARTFAAQLASKNYGPYVAAYSQYFNALMISREGKASVRRRAALAAAKAFEQIGMSFLAARATELAGRQKQALAAYRHLGAVADVNRLEQLFVRRGDRGGVLTRRQLEVARLIAGGEDRHHAAALLRISDNTLRNHMLEIYRRLEIRSRNDLRAYLRRLNG